MADQDADADALIDRARRGDDSARQELLAHYRGRLRKMVAFHLDRRLAARLDPSDVVQEALAEAARKLDDYLRAPPLPFYPWLRRLAWERLVKAHERHLRAQKRSARREEPGVLNLPDESALELAGRLLDVRSGPGERLLREELRARVRAALDRLAAPDREVLVLRYLEQLSHREIAAVVGASEAAVKARHVRALERLRGLLGHDPEEEQR
jgi:RNA polymerase sigma-70 factor (ECF subfamily)